MHLCPFKFTDESSSSGEEEDLEDDVVVNIQNLKKGVTGDGPPIHDHLDNTAANHHDDSIQFESGSAHLNGSVNGTTDQVLGIDFFLLQSHLLLQSSITSDNNGKKLYILSYYFHRRNLSGGTGSSSHGHLRKGAEPGRND
jgi:hypothetical protein